MHSSTYLFYTVTFICFGSNYVFATNLESGLKMAHCRSHCLRKFMDENREVDSSLSKCSICWSTCEKLSTNYPIWRFNCGQKARCDSGCQYACDFMSEEVDVVPLSSYKSRLTLIFLGMSAQWSLTLGPGVPDQNVVFSLFTRTSGRSWQLHLQTKTNQASLNDVPIGTELKLIAVAESGLLSVIITPFDPPVFNKGLLKNQKILADMDQWTEDNAINDSKSYGWLLNYEASVQHSGLIAARIWWGRERKLNTDYLVTWEVAGGGLKGHLYTDIPLVDLTLWPETIYQVQVELTSSSLTEPKSSQPLILNTHNITLESKTHKPPSQPLIKPFVVKYQIEVIIGVLFGFITATALIAIFLYKRRSRQIPNSEENSSDSKLPANRSITSLNFEESLVKSKCPPTNHFISSKLNQFNGDSSISSISCPPRQGNLYIKHPYLHSSCVHNPQLHLGKNQLSFI